jgi:hypothetical protein
MSKKDALSLVKVKSRTVVRKGTNPFAPVAAARNRQLFQDTNIYESLADRATPLTKHKDINKSIEVLKKRLNNNVYTQEHFGVLELVDVSLIDCNINIQRLLEIPHIGNIIERFDPRVMQTVNLIYHADTGRYSAWEGQQSSSVFFLLLHFGLIAPGTKIQCKVVSSELAVPGSNLKGEAMANYGFRIINGSGRKSPDAFWLYRSQVGGAKLYNSDLPEDFQSEAIQDILETNHMFPAPESDKNSPEPGMVTYISGLFNISHHGKEDAIFETCLDDLEWALQWHNKYFGSELGVDGGYILAFGRIAASMREQGITITEEYEQEFYHHMVNSYLTPDGFHKECKTRLYAFQDANRIKRSWQDACLAPIFINDYIQAGGTLLVPVVNHMTTYAGL